MFIGFMYILINLTQTTRSLNQTHPKQLRWNKCKTNSWQANWSGSNIKTDPTERRICLEKNKQTTEAAVPLNKRINNCVRSLNGQSDHWLVKWSHRLQSILTWINNLVNSLTWCPFVSMQKTDLHQNTCVIYKQWRAWKHNSFSSSWQ